jgi:SpoVK/Ycf46/Vps4 family AAA+-type ATPase
MLAAARYGKTLAREWGVGGSGSGARVVALFAGAPGTGKSLTAEAIAGTLGRPLMRITASDVLSKWVDQSESQVSSIFAEARARRAVLFLDEVDSLLMGRDGGNRHDVSLVNTLLVRLEQHRGVVLMATNRPVHLEEALNKISPRR